MDGQTAQYDPKLISAITQAFDVFDPDHQGRLDVREVGTVFRSLGVYPTEAQIHAFITQMQGEDASLWVLRDAFVPFAAALITEGQIVGPTPQDMRAAFRVLDVAGSGMIDAEQLSAYLTTVGEKLSQEEVEAFVGFASKDGPTGRVVEYEEYCQSVADILWK